MLFVNNPSSISKSKYAFVILIIAFLFTGCKHDNELPPTPYEQADVALGGKIYDTFWSEESGFDQTNSNISKFELAPDFYQCSSCHGWDGLGGGGSLIGRTPSSITPYASSRNLYEIGKMKSEQEIFDAINRSQKRRDLGADLSGYDPAVKDEAFDQGNSMPDVSNVLTDAQIWALVKYIKTGISDVNELYSADYSGVHPNGTFTASNIGLSGDANNGTSLFQENCAGCHGEDGTSIKIDELALGGFLRANPEVVHHKAKYGAPDSEMQGKADFTDENLRNIYKALNDESAFPTEVPTIISYGNQIRLKPRSHLNESY